MEGSEKLSLEQRRGLLEASGELRFQAKDRGELYEWVNRILRQQDYGRLQRDGKGKCCKPGKTGKGVRP